MAEGIEGGSMRASPVLSRRRQRWVCVANDPCPVSFQRVSSRQSRRFGWGSQGPEQDFGFLFVEVEDRFCTFHDSITPGSMRQSKLLCNFKGAAMLAGKIVEARLRELR
jgi:hypothetical protein